MRLLHNTILVKPIKEEKSGSIWLLASDQKKQCKGKIVLVGEKCTDERFYEGKVVIYHEHAGKSLPYKDEDDLIVLKVGDEHAKGEVIALL
jgi:co-chaperonin GroES (HSP10)|tara:strand:+ start:32965 stop:33237 length:273 start_codon:yes stop_codon:yes gene_type:complete